MRLCPSDKDFVYSDNHCIIVVFVELWDCWDPDKYRKRPFFVTALQVVLGGAGSGWRYFDRPAVDHWPGGKRAPSAIDAAACHAPTGDGLRNILCTLPSLWSCGVGYGAGRTGFLYEEATAC